MLSDVDRVGCGGGKNDGLSVVTRYRIKVMKASSSRSPRIFLDTEHQPTNMSEGSENERQQEQDDGEFDDW